MISKKPISGGDDAGAVENLRRILSDSMVVINPNDPLKKRTEQFASDWQDLETQRSPLVRGRSA
jgi:hypothetical protein